MSDILKYEKPNDDDSCPDSSPYGDTCLNNGILYHTCESAGGERKGSSGICNINSIRSLNPNNEYECRSCDSVPLSELKKCPNQPSNISELCSANFPQNKKHENKKHENNNHDNNNHDNHRDNPDDNPDDKPDDKPNNIVVISDNTFYHFFFQTVPGIIIFVFLCLIFMIIIMVLGLFVSKKYYLKK